MLQISLSSPMSRECADYSHGLGVSQAPEIFSDSSNLMETGMGQAPDESAVVRLDAAQSVGMRLDRALAAVLEGVSRTRIQRWMALGAVRVDGAPVLPRYRVRGCELITVAPLPTEAERAFEPDAMSLNVVFEDAHVLVVDKPVGLVTHPAPGHWRGTLMNGLLYARPDSARLPRAGIVHRLDRDTSGLLMVARSEVAFEKLSAALAARQVCRRYIAVVEGVVAPSMTVDAPIGRDPRERLRRAVVPHGKPAVTHVERLAVASGVSAVACRLETGRTHQIRVHLAHRGHPLVGDRLYGGRGRADFQRQALHAWRLGFHHPLGGHWVSLESALPPDFCQLWAHLAMPDWASVLSSSGV